MDVKKLRREAEWAIKAFSTTSIHRSLAKDVLRILDAFEAMERDRWQIIYWGDYSDRTGKPLFSVENETLDGPCIAQAKSPLAALLAAAATLEGKTDAV